MQTLLQSVSNAMTGPGYPSMLTVMVTETVRERYGKMSLLNAVNMTTRYSKLRIENKYMTTFLYET